MVGRSVMGLGLCIAGCGKYAYTVSRAIQGMDGLDLFYASRDLDRARYYCDRFWGKGFFGSDEDAAADPRVEAMYFVTPHHLHKDHAILAASRSKHILMEKPIARTLEEAGAMSDAATDAGVKFMVAENARFIPSVRKCKDLLDSGAVGRPRFIQAQTEEDQRADDWRNSLEMNGGGVLIDGGIHVVDNLVHMGGMPSRVYARILPSVSLEMDGEDGMAVTVDFADGATGLINFSTGNTVSSRKAEIVITGVQGRISVNILRGRVTLEDSTGATEFQFDAADMGWRGMFTEFADCILEDREPGFSIEDAARDLRVVLAAYESAGKGAPVDLA